MQCSIEDLVLMKTKLLKWSSFSPHFTQKASFSPNIIYLRTWKCVTLLCSVHQALIWEQIKLWADLSCQPSWPLCTLLEWVVELLRQRLTDYLCREDTIINYLCRVDHNKFVHRRDDKFPRRAKLNCREQTQKDFLRCWSNWLRSSQNKEAGLHQCPIYLHSKCTVVEVIR